MSTPAAVCASAGVRGTTGFDPVLASLPRSYVHSQTSAGSLVVVSGSTDWPIAASEALDAGAHAVLVVHPQPADVETLRSRGALVVLDSAWASNPITASAALAFITALPRSVRLECETYLPVAAGSEAAGSEATLLDQLALVRALVGPVTDLRLLVRWAHGYAAEGLTTGHPVDLDLTCTDAVPAHTSVRLLTDDGGVHLVIPSGETAQPAELTVTAPNGTLLAPTLYESGHRAA